MIHQIYAGFEVGWDLLHISSSSYYGNDPIIFGLDVSICCSGCKVISMYCMKTNILVQTVCRFYTFTTILCMTAYSEGEDFGSRAEAQQGGKGGVILKVNWKNPQS